MNERIKAYLATHPSNRTIFEKLYELIHNPNQCNNTNLTITASFEPSDIKDINIEQLPDSAGVRYTLHLALNDTEYSMQFDIPGEIPEH